MNSKGYKKFGLVDNIFVLEKALTCTEMFKHNKNSNVILERSELDFKAP